MIKVTNKRFYWIKLKTDFFNQGSAIDFLLSQKNGCEYVVLYQMLCLSTINTNGHLVNQIGEMIIPYDIQKIVRDTKYFSYDTVVVAMELYKKLGLIFESDNGNLVISEHQEMVGSETNKAQLMRNKRKKEKESLGNNVTALLPNESNIVTQSIDIRDKSIESRNKDKEFICLMDKQINAIVESMNEKQKQIYHDFFKIEPFIEIPTKSTSIPINHEMIIEWDGKYPNVCVCHELQEIDLWLQSNGSKMNANRTLNFIEKWLAKHQAEDKLTDSELEELKKEKTEFKETYKCMKERRQLFFDNMNDEEWLSQF